MQNFTENMSLNIDAISAIIERHGIDVKQSDDECIYINISSIPIFMRHDSESRDIVWWTYLETSTLMPESELIAFANQCNYEFNLVQFSFSNVRNRFYGHYTMLAKDGLIETQLLRTLHRFSIIFGEATSEGVALGYLKEIDRTQAPDATERPNTGSTMH